MPPIKCTYSNLHTLYVTICCVCPQIILFQCNNYGGYIVDIFFRISKHPLPQHIYASINYCVLRISKHLFTNTIPLVVGFHKHVSLITVISYCCGYKDQFNYSMILMIIILQCWNVLWQFHMYVYVYIQHWVYYKSYENITVCKYHKGSKFTQLYCKLTFTFIYTSY